MVLDVWWLSLIGRANYFFTTFFHDLPAANSDNRAISFGLKVSHPE
jgi:hypothetical protein